MASRVTANELLHAIAATGYFTRPDLQQELFRRTAEDKLNISLDRAIDLLKEAGLATFSYPADPGMSPRDVLDQWQVSLTVAGQAVLSGKV